MIYTYIYIYCIICNLPFSLNVVYEKNLNPLRNYQSLHSNDLHFNGLNFILIICTTLLCSNFYYKSRVKLATYTINRNKR